MSSDFFVVEELCAVLISYLDYFTIIALDESNICHSHDYIKVEDIFHMYLNEWKERNDLISYINDSGIFLPGGGHAKYTIFSVQYSKDINTVNEYNLFKFLPQLSIRYINRKTFDDVKCYYSNKKNKWQYNLETSFAKLFENQKNEWMFRTDYMEQLKYESHQFELLLQKINDYIKKNKFCDNKYNKQIINTINNIFNIKNNKKVYSMIKKWYLFLINGQEDSNEQYDASRFDKYIIAIYGHFDNNFIPKDFIKAFDDDEDSHDSDSDNEVEFDTFITFQICIIDITYE